MTIEEQVLREMQMQTAILRAAHSAVLTKLAEDLRSDEVNAAIIAALSDAPEAVSAGTLIDQVVREKSKSKRTIQRRFNSLEEIGVVRRIGTGSSIKYELTGLVN